VSQQLTDYYGQGFSYSALTRMAKFAEVFTDKHERRAQEQTPLGIILCAGKKQELVELMELGQSGIHIAEYVTELPPKELLEQKLHSAIKSARERIQALPEKEAEQ